MADLEKTLLEIKDMTAALNKSTDSITSALLAVDRYLTSCGVGIVVNFPIHTGTLVYRRHQGHFHILARQEVLDNVNREADLAQPDSR